MAHIQQFQFFKAVANRYPNFFLGGRAAEIGSLDINGSIRDFFKCNEYIGFDVSAGAGVDEIQQGQLISSPTGHFDVAISAECFEHNPFWVETFANMLLPGICDNLNEVANVIVATSELERRSSVRMDIAS